MPRVRRRPRTFVHELRSIARQLVVLALFVAVMWTVVLPSATGYIADTYRFQITQRAEPSATP